MKLSQIDKVIAGLAVRPAQRDNEWLLGYLLRVAEDNGIHRGAWLYKACGIPAHSRPRICPACLEGEDLFWRNEWGEAGVYWCSTHLYWLVDTCPACESRIRWRGVTFRTCGCGLEFRCFERLAVSERVLQCAGGQSQDQMLTRWLGALSNFGLGAKAWKRVQSEVPADVHRCLSVGAAILASWPERCHRLLDEIRVKPEVAGPQSINDAFPGLMRAVGRLSMKRHRSMLLDALSDYVSDSQVSTHPLFGRNPKVRSVSRSITKTAKQLGTTGSRLRKVMPDALSGRVLISATKGKRTRGVLPSQDAQRVKVWMDDQISITAAAHIIGLSAKRIGALIQGGQLRGWHRLVSRSSCLALIDALATVATVSKSVGDQTRVGEAMRLWIPTHRTQNFVHALYRGEIAVYRSENGKTRPGDLLVSRSDVVSWSMDQTSDMDDALTVPQAAQHLGIKQEVAYHLVRIGLLETYTMQLNRRPAQVVSRQSLRRFEQRVEPLASAALRAGVDPRRGLDWAKQSGQALLCGPSIDGCRQYFIEITRGMEMTAPTLETSHA